MLLPWYLQGIMCVARKGCDDRRRGGRGREREKEEEDSYYFLFLFFKLS